MDAIIEKPQRYTFVPPITIADIKAASNGFQADLDLIAAAASAAMNHPASAMMTDITFSKGNDTDPNARAGQGTT